MDRRAKAESEALQRLEVLLTASRILAQAVDDVGAVLPALAGACIPSLADLCAVETVDDRGNLQTAAYEVSAQRPLDAPATWVPVGQEFRTTHRPVLSFDGHDGTPAAAALRRRLGADSVIVAPVDTAGVTIGWLVFAAATGRRGFRPSATRVAGELSNLVGATVQRVSSHRAAKAAAEVEERRGRQLRRLAAASANLAGATERAEVLKTACVEVCLIVDAGAALAEWHSADGASIRASAGPLDDDAEAALRAALANHPARSGAWYGQALPCADPADRAALVVRGVVSEDEMAIVGSLSAIIPVAFERAATTDAAAAQERRLQAVLDSTPVALFTTTAQGAAMASNPAARELFGWSDGVDRDPSRGLHPRIAEVVAEAAGGATVTSRQITAEGLELMVSAAPFPGLGNEAVIAAAVDIREQRAAQRALLQAQRLEAIGQVAGGVAHDFNNRLTVITGYASMLARAVGDDQQRAMVAAIERAADDGAKLTRRLLGLTRATGGAASGVDLVATCASLGEVLERIVGAGVHLRLSLPRAPVTVAADAAEVEQIVLNLAINASDAMEGSGNLSLDVRAVDLDAVAAARFGLTPGRYGRLVVEDDGPGMSDEVLSRCLEPFFTTKERSRGSGLGLSTVHTTVNERKGHLVVESDVGRGTRFQILLPEAAFVVHDERVADDPEPPRLPSGTTVLLVEDEDQLRSLASHALQSAGAVVTAAANADVALATYRPGLFSVVVTDVVMPGCSGVELADRLWDLEPGLPVLFVTGYGAKETGRLRDLPPSKLLLKPYRPTDLVARVAAICAGLDAETG